MERLGGARTSSWGVGRPQSEENVLAGAESTIPADRCRSHRTAHRKQRRPNLVVATANVTSYGSMLKQLTAWRSASVSPQVVAIQEHHRRAGALQDDVECLAKH
eukprot:4010719-Amphidinium_carterae.1